ncbi:MAG: carbohydrate porin, partial [Nannocystaceae bacterium]
MQRRPWSLFEAPRPSWARRCHPRTFAVLSGALAVFATPAPAQASPFAVPAATLEPAASAEQASPSAPPTPASPPTESTPPGPSTEDLASLQARIESLESRLAQVEGETNTLAQRPSAPDTPPELKAPGTPDGQAPPNYADGFHFGSYGRVVVAGDGRGRPGQNTDIVAHGSRLDENTYAELELRREDAWESVGAYTRIVATMAMAAPVFHYDANFDAKIAIRNLYLEETGLGLKGLSVWAGSRMYRGDDIYVLDWWPLDNLNTMGGGAAYRFKTGTFLKLHSGINQPQSDFYVQSATRSPPLAQPGAASVNILDRQKITNSLKLGHVINVGETGGVKVIAYGETHHMRAGQREIDDNTFEDVPSEFGYVAGGELSLFTGKRSTHLNAWVRYAGGLAAYGDFARPTQPAPDNSTKGARELVVALGGNYEIGPFGLMLGSYYRSFRNASPALDYDDIDEGIVLLRPQFWIKDIFGLALEGSYQVQQRGALWNPPGEDDIRPLVGTVGKF